MINFFSISVFVSVYKSEVGTCVSETHVWVSCTVQQTCIPLSPLGKPTNSTIPSIIGWPGSPGKPTSPWIP